jgi:hypothetical protein
MSGGTANVIWTRSVSAISDPPPSESSSHSIESWLLTITKSGEVPSEAVKSSVAGSSALMTDASGRLTLRTGSVISSGPTASGAIRGSG